MRQWLRWRLRVFAFPCYECEHCVGQEPWHGCYCAYHGALSPCNRSNPRFAWLRNYLQRKLEPPSAG
jgi:hypothetical protein